MLLNPNLKTECEIVTVQLFIFLEKLKEKVFFYCYYFLSSSISFDIAHVDLDNIVRTVVS